MPATEPQKETGEENLSTLDNNTLLNQTYMDANKLQDAVAEGNEQETKQLVNKVDKEVKTVEDRAEGVPKAYNFGDTEVSKLRMIVGEDPKETLQIISGIRNEKERNAALSQFEAAWNALSLHEDASAKAEERVRSVDAKTAKDLAARSEIAKTHNEVEKKRVKDINNALSGYSKLKSIV